MTSVTGHLVFRTIAFVHGASRSAILVIKCLKTNLNKTVKWDVPRIDVIVLNTRYYITNVIKV